MKTDKKSVGRAVDQPDPKIRFYLFFGADEGQSRALAARLLEALGAAKFAVSMADLKDRPGVVADEAAALSLFGEKRLIWVEPATNDLAEAFEPLLALDEVESRVVAIAGGLTKSSALVKLAEASPNAVAYNAYVPNDDEAARLVSDLGRRVGLNNIAAAVAARIASACSNDQAIIAQELEKLALYVGASTHAPKELTHDALDAVGADAGEGDIRQLADLALAGEMTALAEAMARLPAGGSDSVLAVRALQRRLLMLAPARARVERGERLDAVLTSMGNALFWKDKPAFEKMLRKWSANDLATVAQRAGALERSLMFTKAPQQESLAEELLAIARKARSAR